MTYFDCARTKWDTRELIRTVKPSPLMVTLVFLILANGMGLVVREMTANPFQDSLHYLEQGYDPVEVFSYVFRGFGAMVSIFLSILLAFYTALLSYGYASYSLHLARGEEGDYGNLLEGFGLAVKVVLLDLLQTVFICLWSMLFVIPGIIASYRYSQAVFCLVDDPEISPFEALNRSKQMMRGHKLELFGVQLSFFGWMLLRILVSNAMGYLVGGMFGAGHFLVTLTVYIFSDLIGLWLMPYMNITFASYYNHLSGYTAEGESEYGPRIQF